MKKLINIRLPVILALSLAAGVGSGYLLVYFEISILWLTASVPISAALIIVFTAVYKSIKPLVFIILAAVFALCGAFLSISRLDSYGKCEINTEKPAIYEVYGTVKEKGVQSGGEYIIVNHIIINGKKAHGNIIAYLSETYGEFCDINYKVFFLTELYSYDTFPYGKLNPKIHQNVKYYCNIYADLKSEYRFSLFGTIRSDIEKTLYENLSTDTASIVYAMLTGNTQDIESGSLQNLRHGGIAHIFAVSGLHIGIIFGILTFLCKKLKLNKYISTAICVFCVFFYSGICGFTVSSIRAAIMCTVAALCKLLYVKSDRLNSLAIAVIIILFISPLSLFTVGFQLSVCATGGIILLSKPIERGLKKIKLPKTICSYVGVTFAAQAGSMPAMLTSFGYISGVGLLLNLIIIPAISLLFGIIFISVLLSLIIPPLASIIVPIAVLPLEGLLSFLIGAGFEKAIITGFGAGLFVPLYFIAVLFATDKLNLRLLKRAVAVISSIGVLTAFVLIKTYHPESGYKIAVSAYNGGGDVIIKSSRGTVLIVGEDINSSSIAKDLNENYASRPDAVIILGGETCVSAFGKLNVNCKNVYICFLYIDLQPYTGVTVHYENKFALCGIDFEFLDGTTLLADCDDIRVGICTGEKIIIKSCDLLISQYENKTCASEYTVYFNQKGFKFNVYEYGDITFHAKDGDLKIKSLLPNRTSN